jgi:hypothetical protein
MAMASAIPSAPYGFYGDGECDTFCPMPDPDCMANDGGVVDVCEENGWYGDFECDEFCLLPDPDCEGMDAGAPPPDAGPPPPDAGPPPPDAGPPPPDAGPGDLDASVADAGTPTPDAGPPPMDAGPPPPDAGPPPPDAGPPPATQIINGDFEDWTTENPPPGFEKNPPTVSDFVVVREQGETHGGLSAAFVAWNSTVNRELRSTTQVAVTPGVEVICRAWVIDDHASNRARLFLQWYDATGTKISGQAGSTFGAYSVDDNAYQDLRVAGDPPAEASTATCNIRFYDAADAGFSGGLIIVDDMEFL